MRAGLQRIQNTVEMLAVTLAELRRYRVVRDRQRRTIGAGERMSQGASETIRWPVFLVGQGRSKWL